MKLQCPKCKRRFDESQVWAFDEADWPDDSNTKRKLIHGVTVVFPCGHEVEK